MNEFLAFISNGTIESFESNFKERFCYLLKIVYYSFALFFVIALVHGVYLYFWSEDVSDIIRNTSNTLDRESLIPLLIVAVASPIYLAFAFTLCLTSFSQTKIAVCISIVLSSIISYGVHYFRIINFGSKHYLLMIILFLSLIGIFYLILSNLFSSKTITKIENRWNNRLMLITYLFIGLTIIGNLLYFRSFGLVNIISTTIISAVLLLLLIYIRRLLGFYWSISLHYLLLTPSILLIAYLIIKV